MKFEVWQHSNLNSNSVTHMIHKHFMNSNPRCFLQWLADLYNTTKTRNESTRASNVPPNTRNCT